MTQNRSNILIYDGDCGFCERTARMVEAWTNGRVTIRPWQRSLSLMAEYGLTAEDGMTQVWYINNDIVSGGASAVNDAMRLVWWARPFTYLYHLPGIRQLEDRVYRWVANNRYRMPGSTASCNVTVGENQ
ncbi:MAG: DUF393 domain-containing protein [Candidatus Promineifilaceae bacterium]